MHRRFVDLRFMENPEPDSRDVSEGKVRIQEHYNGDYPYCKEHGAMLKVCLWENNEGIWRCPTCHVGAYEVRRPDPIGFENPTQNGDRQ